MAVQAANSTSNYTTSNYTLMRNDRIEAQITNYDFVEEKV